MDVQRFFISKVQSPFTPPTDIYVNFNEFLPQQIHVSDDFYFRGTTKIKLKQIVIVNNQDVNNLLVYMTFFYIVKFIYIFPLI